MLNSSLDHYKSRLVAKDSQCPGFDFKETFAPIVHYSTIHIVLPWLLSKTLSFTPFTSLMPIL